MESASVAAMRIVAPWRTLSGRRGGRVGLWGIGEEKTYKQLTFNVQLPCLAAEAAMLATER